MVLRGAAGLYYVHANFQNISNDVGTPPFGASPSAAAGANGAATSQNPYIQPYVTDSFKLGNFIPYTTANTLAVFVQDPNYRPGRIAQYSLDTQIQITPNTVFDRLPGQTRHRPSRRRSPERGWLRHAVEPKPRH